METDSLKQLPLERLKMLSKALKAKTPLLGKCLDKTSPQAYRELIQSFYVRRKATNETESIPGISISWKSRIIIRTTRVPKYITESEIKKLAKEFNQEFSFIYELFKKRNWDIRQKTMKT